ncbi:MAG TPA: hypothetical protein VHK88_07685 [Aquihabitans sp.]|jgi:hypothetical protein|nr:hypothetical protein [Aquihabitans sp.]
MPSPSRALRRAAPIAVAAALCLAPLGCSDDGDAEDAQVGSGATAVPSSTTAPTTATTAPPTTPTTLAGPTGVPTGEEAARKLYDAFAAGDRAAAATIAEPAAIEAVFAAVPGPYELYRGCDTGEFDTGGCLFRDRSTNNTIQIDLERRDTGWVVTGAFFSPG